MKKLFVLCWMILVTYPTFGFSELLTVQVTQAQLRSEPSFLSRIITHVFHQKSVEVLEARGAWRRVKFEQQQGWLHVSALLKPKSDLEYALNCQLPQNDGKILTIANCGGCFLANYERNLKKNQNLIIAYAQVDMMEKIQISPPELIKFAADGKLR